MRLIIALTGAVALGLALGGCSVDDDLRQVRDGLPPRVAGLAWVPLQPLGQFAAPIVTGHRPPADPATVAARARALRQKARALRNRPVLSPARARAMRAALLRFGH